MLSKWWIKNIFLFVLSKYNLFVQELKKYIVLQSILHFCVEWHGGQKNFGHVLKHWKQNRMAWRVNHSLGTQGHHGSFAALLASVTLQSIHNGTDVKTKKRDNIKVSPNFLVVWTSGPSFCNSIHVKPLPGRRGRRRFDQRRAPHPRIKECWRMVVRHRWLSFALELEPQAT